MRLKQRKTFGVRASRIVTINCHHLTKHCSHHTEISTCDILTLPHDEVFGHKHSAKVPLTLPHDKILCHIQNHFLFECV